MIEKKIKLKNSLVGIFYVFFYGILLFPRIIGAGQFWDNVFPYFSEHIKNYFWFNSFAWTSQVDFGQPLSYSSDYFFRFIISNINWVNPEILFYGIYLCFFIIGSYGVYFLLKEKIGVLFATVVGTASFINPGILYKLNAGHIDYFVSYVIFVYLLVFLIKYFRPSLGGYVTLSLFLAFIGVQIQFFVFAGIFIFIYFLCNPNFFRFKYSMLIIFIPFILNLVWLSNFIFGGSEIVGAGIFAAKQKFDSSTLTTYLNIFYFEFSKATSIFRIYTNIELLPYFLLFFYSLTTIVKNKTRDYFFIIISLIFFVFLGTGTYQNFDLWPVSLLYPMFRESGHFAPIIIFFSLLLLVEIRGKYTKNIAILLLILATVFSTAKFYDNSHKIDYSAIRNDFFEFENFSKKNSFSGRVITYPFFGQYAFIDQPTRIKDSFRLDNTGYDSFMKYAGIPHLDNSMPAFKIKDSLQYYLLQKSDLKNLALVGVDYIFDFSNIYESYFEKYVPEGVYDNNLSLIKNNPSFFEDLIKNNPNNFQKVSSHIYLINNSRSNINTFDKLFYFESKDGLNKRLDFFNKFGDDSYFVTETDGKLSSAPLVVVRDLFNNISVENGSISDSIGSSSEKTLLYVTSGIKNLKKYLVLNGKLISQGFVSLNNDTNIFEYKNPKYKFENLIKNSSFELGTWQEKVRDCHNFDKNPILAMDLNREEKSDGNKSLQLEATRHNACTSINLNVISGGSYLFGFDYQSPNSDHASYYLGFNDKKNTVIKDSLEIKDENWNTFSKTIKVPEGATNVSLYVYADSTDEKTNIINRYDNFKMIQVPDLTDAYYLVSEPEVKLVEPKSVTFDLINPTKKLVHIKDATTPFYLAMSESYHPQWQLQFNNGKVNGFLNSWVPFVKPDKIENEYHYKLNDFLNAWYVDTNEYCTNNNLCIKNADGSYDIEMTIEFFPQRWFYLGLIISGTTLAGCLSYLGYEGIKRIRIKIKKKNEKDN